jgi:hypothetical protein
MSTAAIPAIQQIEPHHCISKGYKSSGQQHPDTCTDQIITILEEMNASLSSY